MLTPAAMSFHASSSRIPTLTLLAAIAALPAVAQVPSTPVDSTSDAPAVTLPPVLVESESDRTVQAPFLPDVQGTTINAGKKTSVIDFDALPDITGNNYRQALIQTPGLILEEESTPLISIGYRGLEPHRAQYTQVLKDGIPIHADQFGYPEAYYTPPLDTVDRIEFVRGGAALQYGPQPGGALNFITHRPRTDRQLSGGTENTFGEDNTWNSFTWLDGTTGRLGYYGYFNRRETDGFRDSNSDVEVNAWEVKLALDATGPSRWFLTLESYEDLHGEPGGLTVADFASNRDLTTRPRDRFELQRDAATLTYERDLDAGQLTARFWAVEYLRASARQQGGGYGVAPLPNALFSNQEQKFRTFGAETRYRRDWGTEGQHVFSSGVQAYYTDSPRTDGTGTSAFDNTTVTRRSQREIFYAPVFAENLFRFGNLSVTPGVRVETFRQTVDVSPNSTAPDRVDSETVPLFGLGLAYDLPRNSQVYANFSESYRPVVFSDSVPTGAGVTIADDLAEGRVWQAELGYRSEPVAGLVLDASVFHMVFDDKVGTVGGVIQNVGQAEYSGVELSAQYDVLRAFGGDGQRQLNVFANALLLDAEYTDGPSDGFTPQYAPDYTVRTGAIYSVGNGLKLALLGTFVGDNDGSDNNARPIPAYMVWDLTAEAVIPGTPFTALAGINNLFNEDYYSRNRSDGIDPGAERNYYVGFRAEF